MYIFDFERLLGKEAKPCPFCGGQNITIITKEFFDEVYEKNKSEITAPPIEIECKDCHTVMKNYGDTLDYDNRSKTLIDAWNTRKEG